MVKLGVLLVFLSLVGVGELLRLRVCMYVLSTEANDGTLAHIISTGFGGLPRCVDPAEAPAPSGLSSPTAPGYPEKVKAEVRPLR